MTPRHATQADTLDEMLDVLSDPHRRRILTRLSGRDGQNEDELGIDELVDDAEFEAETLSLLHDHLPKLDELGFVDWEREQHLVTRGPRFHEIAPLIDLLVAHQGELPVPWL